MLLEIRDPLETREAEKKPIVGIDLGTTNSLIAARIGNKVELIYDSQGREIIASRVSRNLTIVGEEAGDDSLRSVKRLLGRSIEEIPEEIIKHNHLIDKVNSTKASVMLRAENRLVSPVEVSARILIHLKEMAEAKLKQKVEEAVITVPAYFNEVQRQLTKNAANMAGLAVRRLISEPTAAAFAYGLEHGKEGKYAIYDLGGGTFDVTILDMQMGVFKVIATGGDDLLGGDDIDANIAEYLSSKYDLPSSKNVEIIKIAKYLKENLSEQSTVRASLDKVELELSQEELLNCSKKLVGRTIKIFKDTLDAARIKESDLEGIVLVGGSTKMPLIQKALKEQTICNIYKDINPDTVVAVGAACQAANLAEGGNNLLIDVVPLSLGIEVMGGMVQKLIHRNTPIPASAEQKFTTYVDGQSGIKLHVLQGEREVVSGCRSLAEFELKGIPPAKAGIPEIIVKFDIDSDGILTISAIDNKTGNSKEVEVRPSYGLNQEKIEKMIEDSMENAEKDFNAKELRGRKIQIDKNIESISKLEKDFRELISKQERQILDSNLQKLNDMLKIGDCKIIDEKLAEVEQECLPIFDRYISEVLKQNL